MFALAIAAAVAAWPAAAQPGAWDSLPRLCDEAAARAAARSGVPLSVLRAIALTETGRSKKGAFRPWPWTVNMEGKGVWFDTLEEAKSYVQRHHDRGARSYDVGCFQINYRWHGKAFASVDEMFDPDANAAYAARFLRDLHSELGDWSRAAGAYHSRTPAYANRYRDRFDRIRAKLLRSAPEDETVRLAAAPLAETETPAPAASRQPAAIRDNRYPLLLSTGMDRGLASLVPLEIAVGRRLIDSQAPGG